MILVDTSVIVAWLDEKHDAHRACVAAIEKWVRQDQLAVSAVTFAELAAGSRTREHVEEALDLFERLDVRATFLFDENHAGCARLCSENWCFR